MDVMMKKEYELNKRIIRFNASHKEKYITPILMVDNYKVAHRQQYPEGTTFVYSNMTPRSSRVDGVNEVVFFGMQYFIEKYLVGEFNKNFFCRPKEEVVAQYKRRIDGMIGKDMVPVDHIEALHDLGYLPITIKALPEGSLVPLRVPMFTIKNTLPEFFWLTNSLETLMSNVLWMPCTSATTALQYRKVFNKFADETVGNRDFVPFQGHDFSYRGLAGGEAALTSGAAHLLSFVGTDTVPAVDLLEQYYGADSDKELVGCSVSASEHSTASLGIIEQLNTSSDSDLEEAEYHHILRIINKVHPTGIVSYVADTFDFWTLVTKTLPRIKKEVMSRDGKVVVRPDCYDEKTQIYTSEGWKHFKDLNEDDFVAQVNDREEYEFVKPSKIIKQEYHGKMISFNDTKGKVDLLVTPNHRIIFKQKGKLKEDTAENLKCYHSKNFIRGCGSKNFGTTLSDLDRLKIAFQADGSYVTKSNNAIRFSFSKQRKTDRLINLLDRLSFIYSVYDLKDGCVEIHIKCDAKSFSKNFDWFDSVNLCSSWCKDFIEELSYWDATIRNEGRIKFDTTNKSVSDIVEKVAMAAGYGVLTTTFKDNRKDIFSDVYTSNILKNNECGTQTVVKNTVDYSGYVYCVTVPTGRIIVKRNRSVLVSGNSGDPVKIVCGDPEAKEGTPEHKGAIQCLWEVFGGNVNQKGYKELDSHIGLIYGDSITLGRQKEILTQLKDKGFASNSVVLGIGSFTYQFVTRDTFGFAVKATAGIVNGEFREIYKDPKTDNGMKKSARGLLRVENENGKLVLHDQQTFDQEAEGELQVVFHNGDVYNIQTLSQIRNRLNETL